MRKRFLTFGQSFAKNEKTDGRFADHMRHELGLPFFNQPLQETHILTDDIKENAIGNVIEDQVYVYEPGTRGDYHFFTRGFGEM